ncbi:Mce protein [Mycobacterium colombiense]|uniref:Mce protein n=1 Tax=Mycobacterium colombiense TaxID=339268 RepID=UPI00200A23A6|nr:Mce protein [Mycobacterium colombiense]MCK8643874.1 Mce protein [Mycobacterium colombiense]
MTITAEQECSTREDIEKPPGDEQEVADAARERIAKRGTRPWRRYARIALVVAVYGGAVGLAGGLGWKLWDEHQVSRAGQAAQRTAVNYAQVLTSIDSNQVDQNFSAVLDGATGEFKDTYTKASAQLRQLLIDNKATAHGTVVASAIQSQTKNKVVVLLMVDQTVSNAVRPDGRVDRSRMKVTMENVGGHWLASKVELP